MTKFPEREFSSHSVIHSRSPGSPIHNASADEEMIVKLVQLVRFSIIILTLTVVIPSFASDQTIIISNPPNVCSVAGSSIAPTLTIDNAVPAIKAALGIPESGDLDPATYYIIHDVTYNVNASVSQQHWYVYFQGWSGPTFLDKLADPRIEKHFDETRIYGSAHVALVYFHLVPGVDQATALANAQSVVAKAKSENLKNPKTQDPVGELTQTQIEDLVSLKVFQSNPTAGPADDPDAKQAARFDLVNANSGNKLVAFGSYAIDSGFQNLTSTLSYTVDITKKIPAPIQNLQGIASIAFAANGAPVPLKISVSQISLCGGQGFEVSPLPSDMTVTANMTVKDKQQQIGSNTFDNEKKYWYDFSLAFPLKSYNDLTVNSSDLTLTAKNVEKQSLFAAVNLSFIPYDTKKASFQYIPVFLYGLPITGKPLNHHLFALAVGLNRVQAFAGILLNHDRSVANATTPPPGTTNGSSTGSGNVSDSWSAKFTYGINFPVSTVTSLLKQKK